MQVNVLRDEISWGGKWIGEMGQLMRLREVRVESDLRAVKERET